VFWTWCEREERLAVERLPMAKEQEPSGRERWLSAEEIRSARGVGLRKEGLLSSASGLMLLSREPTAFGELTDE
jgi:hypothetical protein